MEFIALAILLSWILSIGYLIYQLGELQTKVEELKRDTYALREALLVIDDDIDELWDKIFPYDDDPEDNEVIEFSNVVAFAKKQGRS